MILRRNSSSFFIVIIGIILSLVVLFLSSRVVNSIRLRNEISVKVCKAQSGNVQNQIDVKVFIKSQSYKEYYGNQLRVKKVFVRRGDYVEKGQKLIAFDNNDMLTQYTQAQIQLENAILQKNQMIISRDNFKKQKTAIQEEIDRLRENQEDTESFIAELEESFEDSKIFTSKSNVTISDYSEEIDSLIKGRFNKRYKIPELSPVVYSTRSAIPVSPPLKSFASAKNKFKPIAINMHAKNIVHSSKKIILHFILISPTIYFLSFILSH